MEKLNWRSKSSQAKSLGTIVSIAGASVVTFYQGPPVLKTLSSGNVSFQDPLVSLSKSDWILGGISLGCAAFFGAAWIILQAIILKKFPAIMIILFFKYIFATILAALFCLTVVTDPNAWKLRFDIGLVAVLYNVEDEDVRLKVEDNDDTRRLKSTTKGQQLEHIVNSVWLQEKEHLIHGESIDTVQAEKAQYFRQQLCLNLWRSRKAL